MRPHPLNRCHLFVFQFASAAAFTTKHRHQHPSVQLQDPRACPRLFTSSLRICSRPGQVFSVHNTTSSPPGTCSPPLLLHSTNLRRPTFPPAPDIITIRGSLPSTSLHGGALGNCLLIIVTKDYGLTKRATRTLGPRTRPIGTRTPSYLRQTRRQINISHSHRH